MSEWAAKRFWTSVSIAETDAGWGLRLDERALKTPAKDDLILPTQAMAELIRAEWDAVDALIDPEAMPFTRLANAAADRMGNMQADVVKMLAGYAETDLLCYRAAHPAELTARQAAAWDAPLAWIKEAHNIALVTTSGVIPIPQPQDSLTAAHNWFARLDPFQLMALHDIVSLSGSAVLGIAVSEKHLPKETAWDLSRIDETWQIELWGEDEDASADTEIKRTSFMRAVAFFDAANDGDN